MITYIGFSTRTHKIIARIICKHFKHCAPIVVKKNKCEIYQFTKSGQITIITITRRDMKILEQYGWKFVKYNMKGFTRKNMNIHALTCVQFTKKFCGIKKLIIQTPYALLKHLKKI